MKLHTKISNIFMLIMGFALLGGAFPTLSFAQTVNIQSPVEFNGGVLRLGQNITATSGGNGALTFSLPTQFDGAGNEFIILRDADILISELGINVFGNATTNLWISGNLSQEDLQRVLDNVEYHNLSITLLENTRNINTNIGGRSQALQMNVRPGNHTYDLSVEFDKDRTPLPKNRGEVINVIDLGKNNDLSLITQNMIYLNGATAYLEDALYDEEYLALDIVGNTFNGITIRQIGNSIFMSGIASVETYEELLEKLTYRNNSPQFRANGKEATRKVNILTAGMLTIEVEGKRHFYESIITNNSIRWYDAETSARERFLISADRDNDGDYKGYGFLATIKTTQESEIVTQYAILSREGGWIGAYVGGTWGDVKNNGGRWKWVKESKELDDQANEPQEYLVDTDVAWSNWYVNTADPRYLTGNYPNAEGGARPMPDNFNGGNINLGAWIIPEGGDAVGWGDDQPGAWDDAFQNSSDLSSYYSEYRGKDVTDNLWAGTILLVDETYEVISTDVEVGFCQGNDDVDAIEVPLLINKDGVGISDADLANDLDISWTVGDSDIAEIVGVANGRTVKVKFLKEADANDPTTFEAVLIYTVTDKISGNIVADAEQVKVVRAAIPSITFSEDEFTRRTNSTNPITFDVNVTDASGTKTASDIVWDLTPNAGVETDFDTSSPKISSEFGDIGTYLYTATLEDTYGCDTLETVTVEIIEPLVITPVGKDLRFCQTGADSVHEISVTVAGPELDLIKYSWIEATNGSYAGTDLTQNTVQVTVNDDASTATFKCEITDELTGDVWEETVTITVADRPTMTIEQTQFNRRVSSENSVNIEVTPGTGFDHTNISWTISSIAGDEVDFDATTVDILTPSVSEPFIAGNHTYTAVLTDVPCTVEENVVINVKEDIKVEIPEVIVPNCSDEAMITVNVTTDSDGDYTYEWQDVEGVSYVDKTVKDAQIELDSDLEEVELSLKITDNFLGSDSLHAVLVKRAEPSALDYASDSTVFVMAEEDTDVIFVVSQIDNKDINWIYDASNPALDAMTGNSVKVTEAFPQEGEYIYTASIDGEECISVDFKVVAIKTFSPDVPLGACEGMDENDMFDIVLSHPVLPDADFIVTAQSTNELTIVGGPVVGTTSTVYKAYWNDIEVNKVYPREVEFSYDIQIVMNGFDQEDILQGVLTINVAEAPEISSDVAVIIAEEGEDNTTSFNLDVKPIGSSVVWDPILDTDVISGLSLTPNPLQSQVYTASITDQYGCTADTTLRFERRGSLKAIADTIYMYQDDVLRQIDILGNDEGVVSTTTVAIDPDAEWVYGEGELTSTGVINFTAHQTPVLTTIVKQIFDYTLTDIHSNTSTATVTVFILPSSREIVIPVCETDTLVAVSDDEVYQVDWAIVSGSEATITTPSGVVSDVSRILSVGVYEYTLKDAGGNPQKSGLIEVKRGTGPSVGIYAYDQQDDLYLFSDTLRIGKYEVLDEKLVLLGTEEEYFGWNINDSTDLKTIADRVDFTWQPVEIIVEKDSLFEYSFMAEDNDGCRAYDTLQIVRFNTAPEMEDVDISIRDGIPARINIDLSDEDTLDDIDTYTVVQEDGTLIHGQAEFYDGEFTYIPFTSSKFTDKVKIRACDFSGECVESYVYIESQSTGLTEVLTPNGDGKNDRFEVTIVEPSQRVHLIVMNRWGNKVYESEDYQDDWSGYSNSGSAFGNELLSQGTYFYIIKVEDMEDITGYVQIAY
ncbi:gliding motility-associated C-terminal domain-containing protein [Aureibacter tunicatorum]|uniref:Gliding motility-associated-like protein n=1 Tax=Aureibacter tunicatorum TaxID=866807 RepID=A0AAE3XMA0_9BACT|nr:gliding motility-associated C-terminal domain-containing protein [Aureibacter tunicatorum]MDR6239047.1 gliding motility-associated-like protein [Aureibacter tunicatorum]BDD05027.1 hypothetical protein AUTU_25100 [Aureibacter tunicatorum]